jgi:hypothetical protein
MWTTENRPRYDRDRLRYPSDLTDAEWQHIKPLPAKRGVSVVATTHGGAVRCCDESRIWMPRLYRRPTLRTLIR